MRACAPLTPARLRVGVPIPVGERSARRSPSQERLRRQPGAVAVLRGSAPFLAAAPTIPAAPTRAAPTARHVPPASCQRPRPPPYQPATTAKSPAAATVAAHRTFEYDAYFGTMSVLMFREDCAFPRKPRRVSHHAEIRVRAREQVCVSAPEQRQARGVARVPSRPMRRLRPALGRSWWSYQAGT